MTPVVADKLRDQIETLTVPHGHLALWSLGQSGFVLKSGSTTLCIDPYLSDSVEKLPGPRRAFLAPLRTGDLRTLDAVLATHEHLDHADPETLLPMMQASENARLVTSRKAKEICAAAGIPAERILTPRLGEVLDLAGVKIHAIPAAHYAVETDADGYSRWMGFLVEINGVSVYHAGDTIHDPAIEQALAGKRVDVALLPINGRDEQREKQDIIGNLWPDEALELAEKLGARVMIGTHNDLFAINRIDPGMLFARAAVRIHAPAVHTLQPGELYYWIQ